MSVSSYLLYAFASVLCIELIPEILLVLDLVEPGNRAAIEFFSMIIATACPFGGQLFLVEIMALPGSEGRLAFYLGQAIVILAILAFAAVILCLTIVSFNYCMGRASERPRRAPRAPTRTADARRSRLWTTRRDPVASLVPPRS
jgi:hypothetical protein